VRAAPHGRPCVVLPAWNEAVRLPALLSELAKEVPEATILVVDDGSRDDTAGVAAAAGAVVLRHPFNLGYGAAIQTGYKYALASGAPWVVQMDADGQHLPAEVASLVAPVARGECDVAIGSRFLEPSGYRMGAARSLGRALFRRVARAAGLDVTDPTSGFQALSPRALALYAGDWFPSDYPDVDVLLAAQRAGLRLREVPVRMASGARSSTLHSGWKPLYYVYKMLLSIWVATRTSASPARERQRGPG
jgi:glycosyltransferase involved in cell wall biosynthesis